MIDDVMFETEERMDGAVVALRADLLKVRTGRASPALIEDLRVDAYGVTMPLSQMATIAAPEPRLLTIRPWDVHNIVAIEKAILKSDLGLVPSNDGRIIRLAIPSLTDERRRDLAKLVSRRVEEARVAVRNVRRDALRDLERMQKEGEITEDDLYTSREKLQKMTDEYIGKVDELGKQKDAEIMEG